MWHAQEHYNSYTQPLINLVSAHILGRVRFCLKFYIILCIFFFTKLKRKNTLIFTIQLSWYSSESMLAKIQGLFKTLSWNSRTFQGFTLKFKDFSRLCEPWTLHSKLKKIQGLFKQQLNSRTFPWLPLKFKHISRLCEPWYWKRKKKRDCLWGIKTNSACQFPTFTQAICNFMTGKGYCNWHSCM